MLISKKGHYVETNINHLTGSWEWGLNEIKKKEKNMDQIFPKHTHTQMNINWNTHTHILRCVKPSKKKKIRNEENYIFNYIKKTREKSSILKIGWSKESPSKIQETSILLLIRDL